MIVALGGGERNWHERVVKNRLAAQRIDFRG
jgi:hypothetical protein